MNEHLTHSSNKPNAKQEPTFTYLIDERESNALNEVFDEFFMQVLEDLSS